MKDDSNERLMYQIYFQMGEQRIRYPFVQLFDGANNQRMVCLNT